jgi:hypothetical protein
MLTHAGRNFSLRSLRCAFSLLLVPLLAMAAYGATYFVAPTGNDDAPGTKVQPWLTLQHAADSVSPGDAVNVGPGSYAGFEITKGGTATARVTFHAEPGAVIDRPTSAHGNPLCGITCTNTDGGSSVRREYYTIEGFTIRPLADGPGWYAGIRTRGFPKDKGGDWAYGIVVRNITCAMRSADTMGLFSSFTDGLLTENNEIYGPVKDTLIYVSNSARNYITRGNYVHDAPKGLGLHNNGDISISAPGLNLHAVIENNVIANVNTGISCDGVQDSVIRNNVVYGISGKGISLYAVNSADGCRRDVVVNNTIHVMAAGQVPLRIGDKCGENVIFNNIFFKDAGGGHQWWGEFNRDSLAKTSFDCNLVTDQLGVEGKIEMSQWQKDGNDENSVVAADLAAVIVNASAGDYHLKAGSPAIGVGIAEFAGAEAPETDIKGTARPQGSRVDIGAYAYTGPAVESTAATQGK